MRQATLIAPQGLVNALPAYFPSTGTIKTRGGLMTAGTEGAFANVTGLVDIPCIVAPERQSIGGTGGRGLSPGDFQTTERAWTAILDNRYAALHSATVALHFVVDGVEYGAVVDGDSQGAYTRLRLTLDEL